jgi:signal transduction histidine kinase/ActR/RegA family two-component response regulator
MMPAPIPPDDAARVAALRSLGVLDSPPEERFDRLTRLAAHLLGVPIALVSLVDEGRQWFKSRQGLEATETPRDISFCGHAIHDDAPFVVPNAAEDPRFVGNPLVTGGPRIRFYVGVPLKALDGHRVGTLCAISPEPRQISRDELALLQDLAAVVEQELLHAELALARDAALAASTAKSEFLANMSHEIRTPLNAVIGLADLLRREQPEPHQRELLDTILTSGNALLVLLNDILDLSKIEAGRMSLEATTFAPREVLQQVQGIGAALVGGKDVDVLLSVSGTCPAAVIGDPTRLRQIVLNLVGNAVKFTERGEVRITVRGVEGELMVEVEDTGIGMDEGTLARVFGAFSQADASTARRFGGSGLGLSIARKLCQLMGGTIEATSQPGVGTRMRVRLPLPVATLAERPAGGPRSDAPIEARSILVVDDDAINRLVILHMLRSLGHEVTLAESGPRCLELCAAGRFDLVLMDVQMPEMDGLETTRALRAAHPWVIVVALSASAYPEDRWRCLEAGMTDFLTKPIQLDALAEAVARNTAAATR